MDFGGFPGGSGGKESTCNVGDLGLIPGLGRSSGEGKGYPAQYSGLENSMDESRVRQRLSDFHCLLLWSMGSRHVGSVISAHGHKLDSCGTQP